MNIFGGGVQMVIYRIREKYRHRNQTADDAVARPTL